jgi:hypothetical protein
MAQTARVLRYVWRCKPGAVRLELNGFNVLRDVLKYSLIAVCSLSKKR